jgi:hypothetical protein
MPPVFNPVFAGSLIIITLPQKIFTGKNSEEWLFSRRAAKRESPRQGRRRAPGKGAFTPRPEA